jgi:hypothetical protein
MTYNTITSIPAYIDEKKKILKDMHIKLADEQMARLEAMTNEREIDRFVHDFIINGGDGA